LGCSSAQVEPAADRGDVGHQLAQRVVHRLRQLFAQDRRALLAAMNAAVTRLSVEERDAA
jgi:hypothetical protein